MFAAEAYRGLHQWNFDVRDGDCVLWRPGQNRRLAREFADAGTVRADLDDGVVMVAITIDDRP